MNFNYCPNCGKQGAVQKKDDSTFICDACDWHFWNNPKAAATTLFVKDNMVLVATRASTYSRQDLNGRPELIGGFVNYNESVRNAARREALEEVGVEITEMALLDVWHHEYDANNMPPVSALDCVFVVTAWKGEFKTGDDVASLEWRPLEMVEDPNLSFAYPGLAAKLKAFLKSHR